MLELVVIRNCHGKALMATAAKHISPSALFLEMLAIRSVLSYIHANNIGENKPIIIEADNEVAIKCINNSLAYPPADIRPLLTEVRFLSAG